MQLIFILEIIGTIIFAFAGALVAIQRKLDIFGIIVLAVTTAVGGGMFRDIILGITPPSIFVNPIYALIAVLTALTVIVSYRNAKKIVGLKLYSYLFLVISVLDGIGLGIFTIIGVNVCITTGFGDHAFLSIFVGVITGIGGGLLRDVLANRTPLILKKEIYAVASIIGAILYYYMRETIMPQSMAIYISVLVIIIIRLIALKKNLHLPSLRKSKKEW